MSLSSKVAWTEGLFLRPQHFQQEARFQSRFLQAALAALLPYAWGFSELVISPAHLSLGKVGLDKGAGFFPDGEIFSFPEHDISPTPVDVDKEARGCVVYLCVPVYKFGDRETSSQSDDTRYRTETFQVEDLSTDARTDAAPIEVSRLRPQLRVEKKAGAGIPGQLCIPVARIADISADGAVTLEPGFIPSVLASNASEYLRSFITSSIGHLEGRAETLAARVTGASKGGAAEVADFILMQVVNRYLPIFRHLAAVPNLHPRDVYLAAVNLCGDFAVHTRPDRIVQAFPPYDQNDLTASFQPVIEEVRRCLSFIGDPTAKEMPLTERGFGIRVSEIKDKTLLETAQIVLAVGASIPGEEIRRRFPREAKVGSVDVIRDLVNVALPGVKLHALPAVPRQIPYHAGKVYFELERKGEYWEGLQASTGLAIHIGGEFPDLDLTLWAIRETR